jgi:outer membrane protein assembly factor BamD
MARLSESKFKHEIIMRNCAPARRLFRSALLMAAVLTLTLAGCSREEIDDSVPAEDLYERAKSALQAKAWPQAIDRYKQLTTRYPFGRHAEQAQLDMAFAQYKAGQSEQAITTLDRFIRTYPTHPNVDYAWYLKGLVNYDQSMGFLRQMFPGQVVDRDQTSARQAFMDFQEMIRRFPESRYVADARQRMVFLRNVMAEQDVVIGEYYFRRGAYVAAISRAQHVVETYPQAPANVEALDLMARAYTRLDLPELAADTRRVIEHNYGDVDLEDDEPGFWSRLWPFD